MAQHLVTLTLESESTSDDELPQNHLWILFRNILAKTSKITIFKTFFQLQNKTHYTSHSIGTGKMISRKMRSKLINWIQKLSIETFQFSIDTLLLTIKLLDEYLCLTNESPSQLQLIGCAALYLAAKTSEVVIVAGQCYVTASANCFSKEELFAKEMEIYKALNFNTTFSSLSRVYKYMIYSQMVPNMRKFVKKDIDTILFEIGKNIQFMEWKQHKIICMLVAFSEAKSRLPQCEQLLELLRSYSGR